MSNLTNNLYIGQQAVNLNQAELIKAKIEKENLLNQQINMSNNSIAESLDKNNKIKKNADNWRESANAARAKIKELTEEINFYKNLLSKPMIEIANNNKNFKETYTLQQELLADWMVSQKAFKELAIDFGIQLGKSKEDVVAQGFSNESKVLNNKTKYGNDAKDSSIIEPHIEKLKSKL